VTVAVHRARAACPPPSAAAPIASNSPEAGAACAPRAGAYYSTDPGVRPCASSRRTGPRSGVEIEVAVTGRCAGSEERDQGGAPYATPPFHGRAWAAVNVRASVRANPSGKRAR